MNLKNRDEVNGALKIIEENLRNIEAQMKHLMYSNDLSEQSFSILKNLYIDQVNLNQKFLDVRGWNINKEKEEE
jgi:hypothetical protein